MFEIFSSAATVPSLKLTAKAPENTPQATKRKGSSPNHHVSGAFAVNFGEGKAMEILVPMQIPEVLGFSFAIAANLSVSRKEK